MSKTVTLQKGRYFIGDPAVFIRKNAEGDAFIRKLWDIFYENPHEFREITLDDISFYMMRTKGGDGRFNGIGTDTGTFIIIRVDDLMHDLRFNINPEMHYVLYIDVEASEKVTMDDFNLYFERGIMIITE